jgi:hypothetical protein
MDRMLELHSREEYSGRLVPSRALLHCVAGKPVAVEIPLLLARGWSLWLEREEWRLFPGDDFMPEGLLWRSDLEDMDRLRSLYDFDVLAETYRPLLDLELVLIHRRQVGGNA